MKLEPKPGFDWTRVKWSGPYAPVDETCSYCGEAILEDSMPLRMWNDESYAAVFCDDCMREWWGIETFPDEDEAADETIL